MNDKGGAWHPGKAVAEIYEVVREIGEGGMGVVYLLRQRWSGHPVAAKVPKDEFVEKAEWRKRFTLEARVWTELAAHPNIVRAYDLQEVDYRPCILMEYMDGGSVGKRLEALQGGLPLEEAFRVAIQASWGMAFAHEKGYVHRDLKPANLLWAREGQVKVTDFGLVRPVEVDKEAMRGKLKELGISFDAAVAASMTQGSAVGTFPYMAPEQWEGVGMGAVDVYAFGVVLCELFSGKRPLDLRTHPKYRGMDIAPEAQGYFYKLLHQREEPLDPGRLREEMPSGVRDLIMACLAKRAVDRPETFEKIAEELARSYEGVTKKRFPLTRPGKVELDREQKRDRGRALVRLGDGCQFRGDLKEAMSIYRESEQLFLEIHDRDGLSACHMNTGALLSKCGDYDGAMKRYEESLEIEKELGDRAGVSKCFVNMGVILRKRGDYDGAMKRYEESLEIMKELDDRAGMSFCYKNMGIILEMRGDYDEAMRRFQESLGIAQDLDDRDGMSWCYNNMGVILARRRDNDGAIRRFQQSLEIARELGDRFLMSNCYANMGVAYEAQGVPTKALEMYGRSLALKHELGLPLQDLLPLARSIKKLGG